MWIPIDHRLRSKWKPNFFLYNFSRIIEKAYFSIPILRWIQQIDKQKKKTCKLYKFAVKTNQENIVIYVQNKHFKNLFD